MIDNNRIKDTHQQGIERVKQRKDEMEKGQGGKMNGSPSEKASWKRPNSATNPRGA